MAVFHIEEVPTPGARLEIAVVDVLRDEDAVTGAEILEVQV